MDSPDSIFRCSGVSDAVFFMDKHCYGQRKFEDAYIKSHWFGVPGPQPRKHKQAWRGINSPRIPRSGTSLGIIVLNIYNFLEEIARELFIFIENLS